MIILTNQSPADVPCVSVKLIHIDHSDRKILTPPDLNWGVCVTKNRAQLAVLPLPDLWTDRHKRKHTFCCPEVWVKCLFFAAEWRTRRTGNHGKLGI